MKYFYLIALGMLSANMACSFLKGSKGPYTQLPDRFRIVAHRGDVAHFPENSIEGFISAVRKGADALELDVVLSADQKLVVSHEPYMAARYVLTPGGNPISKKDQLDHNLYKMGYDSIQAYDTGSKHNPKFPDQKKIKTYKPLLEEVIHCVDAFTKAQSLSPTTYLIEIKSKPGHYGLFQPEPALYAKRVLETLQDHRLSDRVIIKSFDPAFLNAFHALDPEIPISYLVSSKGIKSNLARLDFRPDIYSPAFRTISNKKMVDSLHRLGITVLPWTVNRKRHIIKMLRYGVDGIITDFPERALGIVRSTP